MDPQIKKGTLELCILMILSVDDYYGYELAKEINESLEVKEGTIYLVLQRLEKSQHIYSYIPESLSKRKKKYYHLTPLGYEKMNHLIKDYYTINKVIDHYMHLKGDSHE